MRNAAELLRRSAEYARKTLNDVVGVLWREPQPSAEPVYSRYRPRGPAPPLRGPASYRRGFCTLRSCSGVKWQLRSVVNRPDLARHLSSVAVSQSNMTMTRPRPHHKSLNTTGLSLFQQVSPYKILRKVLVRNISQLSQMGQEVRGRLGQLATFRYPAALPIASTLASDALSGPPLVPITTVAVEFDFVPQFVLPLVAELNDSTLQNVDSTLKQGIVSLNQVASDIRKLAQLGELPISMHGDKLRVHFPNCDREKVDLLLADQGVVRGRIIEVLGAAPGGVPPVDIAQGEAVGDMTPGLSFSDSSAVTSSISLDWN